MNNLTEEQKRGLLVDLLWIVLESLDGKPAAQPSSGARQVELDTTPHYPPRPRRFFRRGKWLTESSACLIHWLSVGDSIREETKSVLQSKTLTGKARDAAHHRLRTVEYQDAMMEKELRRRKNADAPGNGGVHASA
jgi:hypothetical protein